VNKKILMLLITVLAVAMLTTPVLAAPMETIELTFFAPLGGYSAPDYWISGNIIHGRGATCNAPTFISWQIPPIPHTDPTKYLLGPSEWVADYDVNLETKKGVLHYTIEIMLDDGTFKGTISCYGTFAIINPEPDVYYANQLGGFRRGVLHGSDEYQGWKIVVAGETLPSELYIYKR
jgi:hypothetical protein